jgi:hypothetical protein
VTDTDTRAEAPNAAREAETGLSVENRDPLSYRILEVVERSEGINRGRGPDLNDIVGEVIRGPISRRAVHGRLGVENRVGELVGREYLRRDGWGAYHVTARGWVEGMERDLEDFAVRK